MRMAKVWRKKDFGHGGIADSGVGHLVSDQLLQLLTDGFRESLVSVRVQVSEYNSKGEQGAGCALLDGIRSHARPISERLL